MGLGLRISGLGLRSRLLGLVFSLCGIEPLGDWGFRAFGLKG